MFKKDFTCFAELRGGGGAIKAPSFDGLAHLALGYHLVWKHNRSSCQLLLFPMGLFLTYKEQLSYEELNRM